MAVLVRIVVDGKLVASGLQNLRKKIPLIGRQQIYNVMTRSKKRLSKPGDRPTYPIPWDSIKQKIKVLILLKTVLHELPYRRRNIYVKAFKIVKEKDGYSLENDSDRAQFMGGDADGQGQSRIHRGRWPVIREVIDEEFEKLPRAVVRHIQLVAKESGFETGE